MRCKSFALTALATGALVLTLLGCVGMQVAPSQDNFKAPTVALSHVEVPYYTGYWYYGNTITPTKGEKDAKGELKKLDVGAPMQMAFIFNITNPASYPVEMSSLNFTILFEGFEVNTVGSSETMWIPAGKTNQLRVPAMFDTRQTLLTLMLPGAYKMKELKTTPWDLLEKWWTKAPDFGFPVNVTGGSAVFKAGSITKVVPFEAKFP